MQRQYRYLVVLANPILFAKQSSLNLKMDFLFELEISFDSVIALSML